MFHNVQVLLAFCFSVACLATSPSNNSEVAKNTGGAIPKVIPHQWRNVPKVITCTFPKDSKPGEHTTVTVNFGIDDFETHAVATGPNDWDVYFLGVSSLDSEATVTISVTRLYPKTIHQEYKVVDVVLGGSSKKKAVPGQIVR